VLEFIARAHQQHLGGIAWLPFQKGNMDSTNAKIKPTKTKYNLLEL
jgi:hypothetical protein